MNDKLFLNKIKKMVKKYPNDMELGGEIRHMIYNLNDVKTRYVYESPDGGNTIYRREFGDYNSPRELVEGFSNPQEVKWKRVPTSDDCSVTTEVDGWEVGPWCDEEGKIKW
jgi:hypothetical protein